jgi:hypothetical protein
MGASVPHAYAAEVSVIRRVLGRRTVPGPVRAVDLAPGERRLGWGVTTRGDAVVASDLALHLPGASRLDWSDVERAVWRRPTLTVQRVAPVEGAGQRWQLELTDEVGLAEVVRSQVTASVAWSQHLRLSPPGGVRLVARRRAGRDALDWQLVFDPGTDPQDPALRAQAEAAMADARRTLG